MATIALVEPKPPTFHIWSGVKLPRLGLPSIGSVLERAGHRVRIYCEMIRSPRREDLLAADIVGISTTTSTAPEAYRLGDLCREAGKPVILGGVHATFCTDEALAHADYIVRGEAENVMPELVERIVAGAPVDDLPGVFTEAGEAPVEVPSFCRIGDLDSLPFPDLSLIEGWNQRRITPVVSSRGCPHNCAFCSVVPMFGRRYRFRSAESVLEELGTLKPREVFFYDDNFTASKRRTVELLEGMLSRGLTMRWSAQVRGDMTGDKELMELFRRAGCNRVYVGYESISEATLNEYNKGETVEGLIESTRIFHEYGISVHGMFVLGGDGDDVESVRETSRFAIRHGINSVQFLILTPIPGSRTYREFDAAGRIFERDWSLYDGHHVVYDPLKMTAAALQREAWKAQRRFYSMWESAKSFAKLKWRDGARTAFACGLGLRCESGVRRFVKRLRQREKAAETATR